MIHEFYCMNTGNFEKYTQFKSLFYDKRVATAKYVKQMSQGKIYNKINELSMYHSLIIRLFMKLRNA